MIDAALPAITQRHAIPVYTSQSQSISTSNDCTYAPRDAKLS